MLRSRCIALLFVGLWFTACSNSGVDGDVPEKASEINGWNGFAIVTGRGCDNCYAVAIPEKFGLKEDELDALIDLNNGITDMEYDLDGPLSLQEDVMLHLLKLAKTYHNQQAAKVLLTPEAYGMDLGAETSEQLDVRYVIPMLESYPKLASLFAPESNQDFAERMCISLAIAGDFSLFNAVAERLKTESPELLNQIDASCALEKLDLVKKHTPYKDAIW